MILLILTHLDTQCTGPRIPEVDADAWSDRSGKKETTMFLEDRSCLRSYDYYIDFNLSSCSPLKVKNLLFRSPVPQPRANRDGEMDEFSVRNVDQHAGYI